MILTDAGPLIAILHKSDALHAACTAALQNLQREPLTTTLPCFVEAMHLLFRRTGATGQRVLWQWWHEGRLMLHVPSEAEIERMSYLMSKYADLPMDLGDASLISAAEFLGARTLFTFDGHFQIYRLADGAALDLIP